GRPAPAWAWKNCRSYHSLHKPNHFPHLGLAVLVEVHAGQALHVLVPGVEYVSVLLVDLGLALGAEILVVADGVLAVGPDGVVAHAGGAHQLLHLSAHGIVLGGVFLKFSGVHMPLPA